MNKIVTENLSVFSTGAVSKEIQCMENNLKMAVVVWFSKITNS